MRMRAYDCPLTSSPGEFPTNPAPCAAASCSDPAACSSRGWTSPPGRILQLFHTCSPSDIRQRSSPRLPLPCPSFRSRSLHVDRPHCSAPRTDHHAPSVCLRRERSPPLAPYLSYFLLSQTLRSYLYASESEHIPQQQANPQGLSEDGGKMSGKEWRRARPCSMTLHGAASIRMRMRKA